MDSLSNIFSNANAQWEKKAKPAVTAKEVEQLADELVKDYKNSDYRKWYWKVIYRLGPERVQILRARCKDADYPGKLFTRLANEEMNSNYRRVDNDKPSS